MSNYRTPLRNARGMGAAKSGSHHFMIIRLTSIALVPLALWFVYAIASFLTGDVSLAAARAFVGHPVNATLLICLVIITFYHSALGVQVVLEDYVSAQWLRLTIQVLFNFLCFFCAVICLVAILKVAIGA